MAKAKRPTPVTQLDPLARQILGSLFAEFVDQRRGTDELHAGYEGPTIPLLINECCADGSATQVDFDLAMNQLNDGLLIKTGPMVAFDNKPNQGFFIMSLYSKNEFACLTEHGYRAAQSLTSQPKKSPLRAASTTITNNFHAPVNAVAQGNASIGSAHQSVDVLTPFEMADVVASILWALPNLQSAAPETVKAAQDLEGAERDMRAGKVPVGRLVGCLNILGKAEDIAIRAPEAMSHIRTLLSNFGWS